MAVTIKKIAELAGVSIGTVDRALNNRKGINKEVSKRINEIANRLNYKPNRLAKALVSKKRGLKIGVIFHIQMNPFFNSVNKGVNSASKELKDFGISVITKFGKNFDPLDQLRLIDELINDGVDAIAIVPINDKRVIQRINKLRKDNFPIVFLTSNAEKANNLVYVGCDFGKVGKLACGLIGLLTNGNANVLYVSSQLKMLGNVQRIKGFKSIINARYPGINLIDVLEVPNDDMLAYRKTFSFLKDNPNIDAMMIATGPLEGVFKAVNDLKLSEKIKIISLDLAQPVLDGIRNNIIAASIIQHPYLQGKKVIEILFDYLVYNIIPKQENSYVECDIRIYENLFN